MAIQDVKCANCGKYLSPVWREKCLHCGVPMAIARPAMIPTPTAMAGQRPVRVQSVLRGPNEAACLQQAVVDGQRAAANGYAPVWQTWGREGADVTLTILYDLVQAAPPPPPPPQPAPIATSTSAFPAPPPVAPPPVMSPPPAAPPAPVVMQPVAWAPPPAPQVIVQTPAPPPTALPAPATPAPAASNPSIANRIFGAIISILVVVVVYWIVAAGERAIF
jgi:hypothetical protein